MRQYHCLPTAAATPADTSAKREADPPFPVVRLTGEGGRERFYRLIPLESTDGYVLYDLSQKQDQRRQKLILPNEATLSLAMRTTIEVVPDTFSHRRMKAQRTWEAECRRADRERRARSDGLCPAELMGENQAGWEAATYALRGIIGALDERNTLLRRHGTDRLFLDHQFRDALLREESQTVGVDKAELKRLFFRWVRYGGDSIALMPRRGGDEPPGTPRVPGKYAVRVGRRDAMELSGTLPRRVKGMTSHWRTCVQLLVFRIIFEAPPKRNGKIDIDAVIGQLKDGRAFWQEFQARCFFGPAGADEVTNRPTRGMIEYHRKRAVDENDAAIREALLDINAKRHPIRRDPEPIPGGAAVDRNADILETIEMDATEFHKIEIVEVTGDGKRRRLGYATLIVACSRSTDTVVGWYAMIGKETTDAYRKCLYWVLCNKAPLLRALGLDPEKMPGILSGSFDEVLVDRGPGSNERMQIYTIGSAKMDFTETRPYTARDKGTVEGMNKLIKEKMNQTKKIPGSVHLEDELLYRYKALPVGFCTFKMLKAVERRIEARRKSPRIQPPTAKLASLPWRRKVVELELHTFMRMVTVAVNALNLQRRTDELALTRDMILDAVPPTRAAMHLARQAERVADASKPADAQLLARDVLSFARYQVIHGKIRHANVWYGAGSERTGEVHPGVRTLLADAKACADIYPGRPFSIEVAFPPDPTRLVALWKRVRRAGEDNESIEFLELPATRRSLRTYGDGIGEEVVKGLRRCILIQKTNADKAGSLDWEEVRPEDDMDVDDASEGPEVPDSSGYGVALPRSTACEDAASSAQAGRIDHLSPDMDSRAMGGRKFDVLAWLKSLRKKR